METDYSVKRGEFSWALEQVKRGKKVARPMWANSCLVLSPVTKKSFPYIAICYPLSKMSVPYIPTQADLLADDWEKA